MELAAKVNLREMMDWVQSPISFLSGYLILSARVEQVHHNMSTFHDLTAAQLRHVIHLKERIEYLQGLLASLRGGSSTATKKKVGRPRRVSLGTHEKKVRQPKLAAPMKARRSAKNKGVRASKNPEGRRMDDFVRFLTDFGGLHDAKVTKFVLDATERSFSLEIDDMYSNFEGLPDYKGQKPGKIILNEVSSLNIVLGSRDDDLNIYDFAIEQKTNGRWAACIKFWPEGKITMSFLDAEFPHDL